MNTSNNDTKPEGAASVPRGTGGLTVDASPLNSVKLDLAILFIFGLLCWLGLWKLGIEDFRQILILGVYGVGSMFWLIFRTRNILRKWENEQKS